jgi:hypothetical protein
MIWSATEDSNVSLKIPEQFVPKKKKNNTAKLTLKFIRPNVQISQAPLRPLE